MKAAVLVLCALASPLVLPSTVRADGLKAVVFDLEPVEIAMTPVMNDRMKAETELLRKMLTEKGVVVLDTAPQAAAIAKNLPLSQCNGCDQDIAKALGADIAVTTAVQQSSAAIFNLSGSIKDVATNRVLRSGVVDVRGAGEGEWNHGIKFLVKERLTDPPLPTDVAGLKAMLDASAKAN